MSKVSNYNHQLQGAASLPFSTSPPPIVAQHRSPIDTASTAMQGIRSLSGASCSPSGSATAPPARHRACFAPAAARAPRSTRVVAARAAAADDENETPAAWDVIEYREQPAGRVRLGVVASVRTENSSSSGTTDPAAASTSTLLVEPLVLEEEGVWAHDERAGDAPHAVALDAVLRIIEFDLQSVGGVDVQGRVQVRQYADLLAAACTAQ